MPWYAVVEWQWGRGYTSGLIETPFVTEVEARAAGEARPRDGYPGDAAMTVTTFVARDYRAAKHEAIRQGKDYRLRPPNQYLMGATLRRKKYGERYHSHCTFCWCRFLDRDDPTNKPEWFEDPADEVVDAGYATVATEHSKEDAHWICEECFDDLAPTFHWWVVVSERTFRLQSHFTTTSEGIHH